MIMMKIIMKMMKIKYNSFLIEINDDLDNIFFQTTITEKELNWVEQGCLFIKDKLNNIIKNNNTVYNDSNMLIDFNNVNNVLINNWKNLIKNFNSTSNKKSNDIYLNYNFHDNTDNIEITDDFHISYFINKFNLNLKQTKTFTLFTSSIWNNTPQILCYLGGEGGSGKSRVIDALSEYFNHYNISDLLLKSAPTGNAAFNIGVNTIHKLLHISKFYKDEDTLSKNNILNLRNEWHKVKYLIIDEISMISTYLLNRISFNLGIAKDNILPFGGIHILFTGDFFQLPPINSRALYCITNTEKNIVSKPNQYIIDSNNGRLLWLSLTHVYILDNSIRHNEDNKLCSYYCIKKFY